MWPSLFDSKGACIGNASAGNTCGRGACISNTSIGGAGASAGTVKHSKNNLQSFQFSEVKLFGT